MNIGVFTTIKIKKGIPLFFDKHKKRLLSQAEELHLGKVRVTFENVKNYLIKNNLQECALKILISREKGITTFTYHPRPLPKPISSGKVISVPDTRNRLKIYKTTDRTANEQAKKFADEHNAVDAAFILNGNIVGSTICNVFSYNKKGDLITPNMEGIGLDGITRQIIMKQATVYEESIPESTNGPLVFTNSLRMLVATHLNERKLADGKPLLNKLQSIIKKAEKEYLIQAV